MYGESFEQGTTAKSGYAWNDITSAGVTATVALDASTPFNPAAPVPSLGITFTSGTGVAGWANRGIGNEGMSLVAGSPYDGYVFVLAPAGERTAALLAYVRGPDLRDLSVSRRADRVPWAVRVPGAPLADEIVFILAMSTGPRVHARMAGLAASAISLWDGLR